MADPLAPPRKQEFLVTLVHQEPEGNLLLEEKLPPHLTREVLSLCTKTSSRGPPYLLSTTDSSTRLLFRKPVTATRQLRVCPKTVTTLPPRPGKRPALH